ncbi:hypothetical protein CSC02_0559 [Enterobacter hormaechei subsp. hoffmannii]|nr:hypothetical protein CSC02_0559 [Enterobacter hormaechei subsp. hoffmannii]
MKVLWQQVSLALRELLLSNSLKNIDYFLKPRFASIWA